MKPNLVLRFKFADNTGFEVRSAARISIDGSGALLLHPADDGPAERIALPAQCLTIHAMACHTPAPQMVF
jgi:hypothetical protein